MNKFFMIVDVDDVFTEMLETAEHFADMGYDFVQFTVEKNVLMFRKDWGYENVLVCSNGSRFIDNGNMNLEQIELWQWIEIDPENQMDYDVMIQKLDEQENDYIANQVAIEMKKENQADEYPCDKCNLRVAKED